MPRIGSPVVIALDSYATPTVCAGLVVKARHDVKVRMHTSDFGISARKGRPVQPVAIRFEAFVPGLLRSTKNIAESHPFIRREVERRCAVGYRNGYAGTWEHVWWRRGVARRRINEVFVLKVDLGCAP
jgi:hypothetical protein